jgi:hypothetical protein
MATAHSAHAHAVLLLLLLLPYFCCLPLLTYCC